MTGEASIVWERVLELIRSELTEISFNTWIRPLEAVGMNDQILVLKAPNDFQRSYAENYKMLIQNSVKQLTGATLEPHIVVNQAEAERLLHVDDAMPDVTGLSTTSDPGRPGGFGGETSGDGNGYRTDYSADSAMQRRRDLMSYYTFENFVVGPSNELAYATCVAVAENKGEMAYNPLFLYGDSGLGKTHLMHAIRNYIETHQPERRVLYVPSEQFVNEFVTTIKDNRYDDFRDKYRSLDVLLIDDIQFIEGKQQMQMEFFHTFNALYEQGSFIVLTCDKSPHNLSHLEDRLRTRFASGWFPEILQPDFEMRKAILKKRAQYKNMEIPEEIFDYIATHVTSNIRELEGAFNTVTSHALLADGLSLENAKIALRHVIEAEETRPVTPDLIIDVTAAHFNINSRDLMSRKRSKNISDPRQIAMYLCRQELDMPYQQIGEAFGGRDHTTVMHACTKVENALEQHHERLKADLKEIRRRISRDEV